MGRGYNPKQIVDLLDAATVDRLIRRLFASEFEPLQTNRRGVQGCTTSIKGNYPKSASPFSSCHSFETPYGGCCKFYSP